MLKAVNLSLSSICGANCIFCPKSVVQETMSLGVARRIVDEISSSTFKKHRVSRINIGENGDAFLNKELTSILRYIKLKLPKVRVSVYTNFQNLTREKVKIILSEQLINSFYCNIDAGDEKEYFFVKGLQLSVIKKNIIDFIETRKEVKSGAGLTIFSLALSDYFDLVRGYLKVSPAKLESNEFRRSGDVFRELQREYTSVLDPKKDKIVRVTAPFFWAERGMVDVKKLNYGKYICPNLERIKQEAFIAPDGTWYACCYDSDMELVLGNIGSGTIDAIYSSSYRKDLIRKLEQGKFQEVGGPCKTVNCCQRVSFFRMKNPRAYAILEQLKSAVSALVNV